MMFAFSPSRAFLKRQGGPQMAHESSKRGPRCPQDSPKTAQERPKRGPRLSQEAILMVQKWGLH
eukprot:6582578-Pyramimonas_sp.AAC.1